MIDFAISPSTTAARDEEPQKPQRQQAVRFSTGVGARCASNGRTGAFEPERNTLAGSDAGNRRTHSFRPRELPEG
jgi:hypothetical protein